MPPARKQTAASTPDGPRFLSIPDVADVLNISVSQTYALVRTKQIKAIKVGGRGEYRIERDQLEAYIARAYKDTEAYLDEHPFAEREET